VSEKQLLDYLTYLNFVKTDDGDDVQEWLRIEQMVSEFDEMIDEYLSAPSSSSSSLSNMDLSPSSSVKTEL